MTRRSLFFLMLGLTLMFGLAACSNSDDSKKSNDPSDTEVTEKSEEKNPIEEANDEEENANENNNSTESSIENDQSIGVSAEEFKEHFNEKATDYGLNLKIEDYEWMEYSSGVHLATIELEDDVDFTFGKEDENDEELKTVLLEVSGHESRQRVFDVIEVLIETSNPNLTVANVKEVMEQLGLTDSSQDGSDEESMYAFGGLKYLVNDEAGNWLEFAIANENDPDFEVE